MHVHDLPRWESTGELCNIHEGNVLLRREAFDLFDTDGSGTIDAKELKVAMRYVCGQLP